MAMPLGGGSTWFHSHDSYFLLRADGTRWGILTASVRRTDAYLYLERRALFAIETGPGDGDATASGLEWTYHHPALPQGYLRRRWRADTPAHELVPHAEHVDGALLARFEADAGAITVTDGDRVPRVHIVLGEAGDPAWPAAAPRIELVRDGQIVAVVCLPTGPGASVEKHATSMP